MKIVIPKESNPKETRIPFMPESVDKLVKKGGEIFIESGLGESIGIGDNEYINAGAEVIKERSALLRLADMIVQLNAPDRADIALLKKGALHISNINPFFERDIAIDLAKAGVYAISMIMIPRTTIAQKMDTLSSQANLAGYVAVILSAQRHTKIFPMMMTPAGTIPPARVFIIGVGVAGLQAIATAKRLGARVEAFDTRPVVEEQVKSLGAKFVKVDLGETGQTKQGYAKELTTEQLDKQREVMAKHCALADVVITTARLFGRRAPLIVTEQMVQGMKKGSIIVDLAVKDGGNVAGSKLDQEVIVNGVRIIGLDNLPGRVALDASRMYSNNMYNLIEHFWSDEKKSMLINLDDEIMQGCLITCDGKICNETIK